MKLPYIITIVVIIILLIIGIIYYTRKPEMLAPIPSAGPTPTRSIEEKDSVIIDDSVFKGA